MEDFEVVGVIKTGSGLLQNMLGNYIPTFVYVPYTTVQTALGRSNFDQIAVKIDSDSSVESAGKSITAILNQNNGTADAFVSNNPVSYTHLYSVFQSVGGDGKTSFKKPTQEKVSSFLNGFVFM